MVYALVSKTNGSKARAGSTPAPGTVFKKNNKFEFRSVEEKQKVLKEIIGYFQSQRNEQIGVLAAEDILNFLINIIGDDIYTKAINDCTKLIDDRFADIKVELDLLKPEA
jgi:uncharacterized protein (DUF2164 family)